jgi:hypothetical protein
MSEAVTFVPSILPAPMDLGQLAKLNVKFLPDCEIASVVSWTDVKDFSHGKAAS